MNNMTTKEKLTTKAKTLRGNATAARTIAQQKPDESAFHKGKADAYDHSATELESLLDEIFASEQGQDTGDAPNSMSANSTDAQPEPAYSR